MARSQLPAPAGCMLSAWSHNSAAPMKVAGLCAPVARPNSVQHFKAQATYHGPAKLALTPAHTCSHPLSSCRWLLASSWSSPLRASDKPKAPSTPAL